MQEHEIRELVAAGRITLVEKTPATTMLLVDGKEVGSTATLLSGMAWETKKMVYGYREVGDLSKK